MATFSPVKWAQCPWKENGGKNKDSIDCDLNHCSVVWPEYLTEGGLFSVATLYHQDAFALSELEQVNQIPKS